jgi:arabinogalactan endo-1,4-beta-galactosidase
MKLAISILLFCSVLISCKKDKQNQMIQANDDLTFVTALDLSTYPEIAASNPNFYDINGNRTDVFAYIKEKGINTIRLRLWVNPINTHCGYEEVKAFSQSLKTKGFNIWLSVHYSDTWADPGSQIHNAGRH